MGIIPVHCLFLNTALGKYLGFSHAGLMTSSSTSPTTAATLRYRTPESVFQEQQREVSRKAVTWKLQSLLPSSSVRDDLEIPWDSSRFSLGVQTASPRLSISQPLEFISILFGCADNFTQLPAILVPAVFGCVDVSTPHSADLHPSSLWMSRHCRHPRSDVDLLSVGLDLNSRPWDALRLFSTFITQSSCFSSSFSCFFSIIRLSYIVFSGEFHLHTLFTCIFRIT